MIKPTLLDTQTGTVAAAANMTSINLKQAKGYGVFISTTVATPTATTFVDADVNVTNNTITETNHGYYTGVKGALTTAGVLPGGLSATDYYVIRVDANTFKLASSAANALAGTAEDITSAAGGGTHTFTPAAISGASYKIQISPDDSDWYDLASATNNVTATAKFNHQYVEPMYNFMRIVWAIAAGQIAYSIKTIVKED